MTRPAVLALAFCTAKVAQEEKAGARPVAMVMTAMMYGITMALSDPKMARAILEDLVTEPGFTGLIDQEMAWWREKMALDG